MEATNSVSDFSKCWLLLQKAHEKEINAVTEEKEKWKGLYETERDLVSSLQKQLNVEMEQLKKLLNIAETKIAEKEAQLVEKDQIISDLESLIKTEMGSQPNQLSPVQHVDEEPGNAVDEGPGNAVDEEPASTSAIDEEPANTTPPSPSLLANTDTLLSKPTPNRNDSETVNHKWTKRKRRKKLKQTTLTQHQSADLKRQKLDQSVRVIPQSPIIDLSTVKTSSSSEDEQLGVEDDMSDEYVTGSENANSQNYDTANQGCSTSNQNRNQDCNTIDQRCHTSNQDDTFIHDVASQECNSTSPSGDYDNTFVPDMTMHVHNRDMVSQRPGPNGQISNKESTNSPKQNHNKTNRHLKDQRELKRSPLDPKFVITCRKKSDRNKLDAAPCHECAQWYGDDFQVAKAACRHRFRDPRPDTPPNFWKIGFPDTADYESSL